MNLLSKWQLTGTRYIESLFDTDDVEPGRGDYDYGCRCFRRFGGVAVAYHFYFIFIFYF